MSGNGSGDGKYRIDFHVGGDGSPHNARTGRGEWPPISFKSPTGKPLASDDVPDLKESNLIISILRTDSARITITHLSIPIISQFVQALCHYKAKWSMKRDECVHVRRSPPARACVCVCVCLCAREQGERKTCAYVYLRGQDNNVSPLLLV